MLAGIQHYSILFSCIHLAAYYSAVLTRQQIIQPYPSQLHSFSNILSRILFSYFLFSTIPAFMALLHREFQFGHQEFRCVRVHIVAAVLRRQNDTLPLPVVIIFGLR